MTYVDVPFFFVLSELRWDVIVPIFYIGGTVDHKNNEQDMDVPTSN
jgi:hypothetical protein